MVLRCRRLSLRHGLIVIICIPTLFVSLLGWRHHWLATVHWAGPKCLGWKATLGCIPLGPRQPSADKTCAQEVRGGSGYCLCEGNITVARMSCGPHRFRCRDKCAELAYDTSGVQPLPKPLVCGPDDGYDLARLLPEWAAARAAATAATAHEGAGGAGGGGAQRRNVRSSGDIDAAARSRSSSRIWDMVDQLVDRHGLSGVSIPGPRLHNVDWVLEGRHMRPADVDKLAAAVAGLLRDLPPYPDDAAAEAEADADAEAASAAADAAAYGEGYAGEGYASEGYAGEGYAGYAQVAEGTSRSAQQAAAPPPPPPVFSGRGVVMVGGGMRYLTPAWTNLHLLRRTGCQLPVELWFPVEEFPTPAVEEALGELGVACRRLSARDLAQRGYGVKVAALLLSSFREVLFLDSDNAVLRDPTALFDSEPYMDTGALLWPDYWDRTAAPEVSRVLNISSAHMPRGTFESGQMVIDKKRHWRGLLVAAYMNVYGNTFSELLSCYVGKGDKETFAYGMLAAGEPVWVSPVKPGSAGVVSVVCSPPGRAATCREQYMGNTMVQHGPDGAPLFFHANYHKWDLALPDSFEHDWNRRWQVLQPGRRSVAEVIYAGNNGSGAGYDVEHFIYQLLRAFRCAPWFGSYHAARVRMGESPLPALDGFHPLPDYITFREFYRSGWKGAFEDLVHPPLSLGDRLTSWYQGAPRWWMRPLGRKLCRLRRKLLPRWLRCRGMK